MAVKRTPFIAGNWKMNLDHLQAIAFVQKLAWSLADAKHDFADAEVAVFPPFTDLRSVQTLVTADTLPLAYGAQDVSAARLRRIHRRDLRRLPRAARLRATSSSATPSGARCTARPTRRSTARCSRRIVTDSCRSSAWARRLKTSRHTARAPCLSRSSALRSTASTGRSGPRRRVRAGVGDRLRTGGDARTGRTGRVRRSGHSSPNSSGRTSPRRRASCTAAR